MRRLIVSEFVSIDGVMEGPGPDDPYVHAGWTMEYGSPELFQYKLDEVLQGDALLLGRETYDGFAAAWPGRTDEMGFADKMNTMPKYVATSSREKLTWNNSHRLKDDIKSEVTKLKADTGKDILVAGSSDLLQALIMNDVVDEYRLMIYPVVLGSGKRLFKEGTKARLKLIDCHTFGSSVVLMTYHRAN
jgi:dihydrofolate reductase